MFAKGGEKRNTRVSKSLEEECVEIAFDDSHNQNLFLIVAWTRNKKQLKMIKEKKIEETSSSSVDWRRENICDK